MNGERQEFELKCTTPFMVFIVTSYLEYANAINFWSIDRYFLKSKKGQIGSLDIIKHKHPQVVENEIKN